MNKFIWTDEYSVGIQLIDEQHRNFFEIANSIIDLAGKDDIAKENLFASLGELGDYAFYHLETEEKYFDEFGYEGASRHIAVHNQYREKIKDYFRAIRSEDVNTKELAKEIASYSSEWLSNHILLVDKNYTKFFNDRGLK